MLNISIPEPCHENWNEMTPTQKGAFCAVCSKEVMDFSNMSDDEVKSYFIVNAGKKTCGRFRTEQLKGLNIVVDERIIYTNIALWKKFLAVVVICFGAFFTSCTPDKATGKVLPETEVTSYTTMGMPPEHITTDTVNKETFPPVKKIIMTKGFCVPKFIPSEEMEGYIQGDIAPPVPVEPERIPVEAAPALIEMPKDSVQKQTDTCRNARYL